MLRERCEATIADHNFCLTLTWRGRNVRHYRFADASDSRPVYGNGTDVRAGRDVRRPSGRRTEPASRWSGACEGCLATRRREGRPRGDRSCLRSEDYSGPYRVTGEASVAPAVYRPIVRDALLDDLDPLQYD